MRTVHLAESDALIYAHEIRPFLPETLFDAHCHLLFNEFHPRLEELMPLARDPLLGNVDLAHLRTWWRALFPDAAVTGLLMGFPTEGCDAKGENERVAQSAGKERLPFAILTRPETPAKELEAEVLRLKPAGLKPYMVFVRNKDPNAASITDLIPEPQIAVAAGRRLAIILHVAKPRGMADPENLRDIARLVREYPNCNFVLAHCGRCFITPNMETVLENLPAAENLWFDTSAVCDIGVFIALFERYDRTRILFGTDLVTAAGFRGSYVRLGMSWHVCTPDMVVRPGGLESRATFAAYENLCALLHAARFCKLSEEERRNIFHDNAARLFPAPS